MTLNSVLSACARSGNLALARKVRVEMERMGVQLDVIGYNALIHAAQNAGEPEEALSVLGEMKQKGLQPDEIIYSMCIFLACQTERTELAYSILMEYREYARGREEASRGRRAPRKNVHPYDRVLTAFAKAGDWDRVDELLDYMAEDRTPARDVTWALLVESAAQQGDFQRALRIIKTRGVAGATQQPQRGRRGARADPRSPNGQQDHNPGSTPFDQVLQLYVAMLKGLASTGRVREAEAIAQKVLQLLPDDQATEKSKAFTLLLRAYAANGDVSGAAQVLRRMGASGLRPTEHTLNAIVRACGASASEEALDSIPKWVELFEGCGVRRNEFVFASQVQSFVNGSRWDSAVRSLDDMVKSGFRPMGPLCVRLVTELWEAGGSEDALWVLRRGVKEGWWGAGVPPLFLRSEQEAPGGKQYVVNLTRQSKEVWSALWALLTLEDFVRPARERVLLPPRPPPARGQEAWELAETFSKRVDGEGRRGRDSRWPSWRMPRLKCYHVGAPKMVSPPRGRALWIYTRRRGSEEDLSPWRRTLQHEFLCATLQDAIDEEELPLVLREFWDGGEFGGIAVLPKRRPRPEDEEGAPKGGYEETASYEETEGEGPQDFRGDAEDAEYPEYPEDPEDAEDAEDAEDMTEEELLAAGWEEVEEDFAEELGEEGRGAQES